MTMQIEHFQEHVREKRRWRISGRVYRVGQPSILLPLSPTACDGACFPHRRHQTKRGATSTRRKGEPYLFRWTLAEPLARFVLPFVALTMLLGISAPSERFLLNVYPFHTGSILNNVSLIVSLPETERSHGMEGFRQRCAAVSTHFWVSFNMNCP